MDDVTRQALEFDRLLGILAGNAQSPLGSAWVRALAPSSDAKEVARRLERTGEALHLANTGRMMPLGGLMDVTPLVERARTEGSVLEPEAWPPIRRALAAVADVRAFGERHPAEMRALGEKTSALMPMPEVARAIDQIFTEDGLIRDDASRELSRLRSEKRRAEGSLKRTVGKLLEALRGRTVLQEDLSTIRNGRHVFPVKSSSRGRVPGIIHGSSATGETVYVEPNEVVEVSNEIELLNDRERQEIHHLLRELTRELRPHAPVLAANLEILAELDGIQALARHAAERGWKVPVIGEGGALKLLGAHHPLLHVLHPETSVPVTAMLDAGDRLILLSGPNAGGKTTSMKTVALCAMLAQCGSPIPASPDARLPVFDAVLADIGDSQDIGEGLSTFTGHVRRLKEILAQAGPRSLVLFDELGTGTDPEEGGALAQATLEELLGRAGLTLATTHLGPLQKWVEDTKGARNASFSLDPETKRPTYRLRLDLPGASEALTIARNEGLSARVLERARSLVGEQKVALGDLLRRIEDREQRLGEALREAEARAESLEQQERLARDRAEQVREERRRLKAEALAEREKALRETRERIEKLIADLPGEDELRRRKDLLNQARGAALAEQRRMGDERASIEAAARQPARPDAFAPGTRVYVTAFGTWGEVLRLSNDSAKARVLIGSVEADVPVDGLALDAPKRLPRMVDERPAQPEEPADKRRKKKKSRRLKAPIEDVAETPPVRTYMRGGRALTKPAAAVATSLGNTLRIEREPVALELDLHGYRVDEALTEMERFLDRALLADYPRVRIIHGTGEGRLYKAVHEYLRTSPYAKSFRFATPDEGGGGCTIVEL